MAFDKTGREIVPGDYIIYGCKRGDGITTRFAKVQRITSTGRVSVKGVDVWAGSMAIPATVRYADRVLILAPEQVPARDRAILDA